MAYLYNREESEATIRLLADRYPKCFFENPQQRKPLKKNIMVDLQNDGVSVASDLLTAALNWYTSHFGYQYTLQAGIKRVDLNGKEVGIVTELEHRAAQIKIKTDKQKRNDAVATLHTLHAQGRIPTDHIRKLDAPPIAKEAPPMKAKSAPALERVDEALDAARALLAKNRDALRTAMAVAALGVVIKETQHAVDELQQQLTPAA